MLIGLLYKNLGITAMVDVEEVGFLNEALMSCVCESVQG